MQIEQETESLQSVVAAEAYRVVERLQKHKPGKELLQMLSTVAREPRSLSQSIQSADRKTMIAHVNRGDSDQKQWFQALLAGNVLHDKDSIACIRKWADLCDQADVSRLLDLAVHEKHSDAIKLVVDCASGLPADSLALVINRFYRKHGIKNGFGGDKVQAQLTLVLNKMECESLGKEVLILLLRDPELVLSLLYKECLKSSMYTQNLADTYKLIKNIVEIEALHLNTLERVFRDLLINQDNLPGCHKFLETLIDDEYFKFSEVVKKVFMPRLQARTELLGTLQLLVVS